MAPIRVIIRSRGPNTWGLGPQGIILNVDNTLNVRGLKTEIQDNGTNAETSRQLLWFVNNRLGDDLQRLVDAGVQDNSIIELQDNRYFRIYFYRPSSATREERYVQGTDTLSAVMAAIGYPNTTHSITMNGNLFQGAARYNSTLTTLGISQDSELRFNVDSTNG